MNALATSAAVATNPPRAAYRPPTREDILAQCIAADAQWAEKPGRNLVLLFDGTGNILGNQQDTNVVKLLRMLGKGHDPSGKEPTQLVYYDPGVGTTNEFPADGIVSEAKNQLRQLAGLALGSGVFPNIAEAYRFLVNTYQRGDRIYLFGFSRGAFTARSVAGMINMYGLIHTEGLPLIETLVRTYFAPRGHKNQAGTKDREKFAEDVINNFSLGRTPLVHFVGVWDTVEAIGLGGLGSIKISNSTDFDRKRFAHVRHAMSLYESRSKYTPAATKTRTSPPRSSPGAATTSAGSAACTATWAARTRATGCPTSRWPGWWTKPLPTACGWTRASCSPATRSPPCTTRRMTAPTGSGPA